MNIFLLDKDIQKCATYHADQHVIKMILEYAQMLCTVLNENGLQAPYKSTHKKHPCTLWAGESLSNWKWLRDLGLALNDEYKYRYGKREDHKSAEIIRSLSEPPIPDKGLTEFPQAMPKEYQVAGDPVQGYRNFYLYDKIRFAKWSRRPVPEWFQIVDKNSK
ncbi:MAG: hypothetical protein JXQ65_01100 [Candidatus Marinimicrobia bacterium]|nr:hypothetical protein [Candidatus Neomarinimicrobiota bacterium]